MPSSDPPSSPPSPPSSSADQPAPVSPHRLEQQRRENRDAAAGLGFAPYGRRTDGLVSLAEARRRHSEEADAAHAAAGKERPAGYVDARPVAAVAGRVVLHRDQGKLVWLTLRDDTGDLQVAVSKGDAGEKAFALAKLLDLGDLVIARGRVMKTRKGEVTVWVEAGAGGAGEALELGAKSLMPPPEKHAGLHDVELRYRRRYVDMWATPETVRVFHLRSRIVSRVRRYMDERAYVEVETPMLQQLAGGAAARPFMTHMNALDIKLYMRIAPELYLKRLLVGGMGRVYEINRNFRNEGLDKQHNPEFTMMEAYCAWGDVRTVMELAEGLVREVARMVAMEREDAPVGAAARAGGQVGEEDALAEDLRLPFGDWVIDYGKPFERVSYGELFRRGLGFAMEDTARVKQEIIARGLVRKIKGGAAGAGGGQDVSATTPAALDRYAPVLLVNTLFEEFGEHALDPARPTFITDYPSAISPLTRPREDRPELADRADLFIGGMEIGPFYTELNDPDSQAAKFREQLAGIDEEEETFRTFDQDFIDALKVGMPPAGGFGLGIDRLVMLMTNQRTIRDVVLFPLMRPV